MALVNSIALLSKALERLHGCGVEYLDATGIWGATIDELKEHKLWPSGAYFSSLDLYNKAAFELLEHLDVAELEWFKFGRGTRPLVEVEATTRRALANMHSALVRGET